MLGRGLDRLAVQSLKHGGRAVVEHTTTYVPFDNSKERLAVASADGGLRDEVRFWGTIPNQPEAVRKPVAKLAAKHPVPSFCYEAGPCGYGLYRQILEVGRSLSGSRALVNPDQTWRAHHNGSPGRDHAGLAVSRWRVAGRWVPNAEHGAIRELIRGRRTAMQEARRAR